MNAEEALDKAYNLFYGEITLEKAQALAALLPHLSLEWSIDLRASALREASRALAEELRQLFPAEELLQDCYTLLEGDITLETGKIFVLALPCLPADTFDDLWAALEAAAPSEHIEEMQGPLKHAKAMQEAKQLLEQKITAKTAKTLKALSPYLSEDDFIDLMSGFPGNVVEEAKFLPMLEPYIGEDKNLWESIYVKASEDELEELYRMATQSG